MKVHELIEKLQRAPQDADVLTEGCDCDGECASVIVLTDGSVLLARPDAYYSRGTYPSNGVQL